MVSQSKVNDAKYGDLRNDSRAVETPFNTPYNPERITGVVEIVPGDFYAKSPVALKDLRKHLQDVGYDVKDSSAGVVGLGERPPRKVQEQEGWALWFGKLSDKVFQRKAECGSCKSLIDILGVQTHGHKCQKCNQPTYLEWVNGGEISFSVVDDTSPSFRRPNFVIHSYDKDKQSLNLYVDPADCSQRKDRRMRNFDLTPEQSKDLVPELTKKFPQTFKLQKIGGVKVLTVNHKDDHYVHEHGINTSHIEGSVQNYRIVKLFGGKEFKEWDSIPIPETVSLYEAWHWAPLKPSPGLYEKIMSAARQVSRKDYYYQDGRPAFVKKQLDWMLKFVEHFTTLDSNEVGKHITPDMSGPGLIDALAKATGHENHIKTESNIFNGLILMDKINRNLHGLATEITPEEAEVGAEAIADDIRGDKILSRIFE